MIPLEGNNRFDDDDDFNAAVVGEGNGNNFVRQYGFGKKNDEKTFHIIQFRQFSSNNKMAICNTVFKEPNLNWIIY